MRSSGFTCASRRESVGAVTVARAEPGPDLDPRVHVIAGLEGIAGPDPVSLGFHARAIARSPHPGADRGGYLEGEAQFAASGTCLQATNDNVWIGTGGSVARVFSSTDRGRTCRPAPTPLQQGTASQGVFGLLIDDGHGIAVGGDYTRENDPSGAIALSHDGGASWSYDSAAGLSGFRSAVVGLDGGTNTLVAVGPAGSDVSYDAGRNWSPIAGPGFHVAASAADGAVWAAGGDGRPGCCAARRSAYGWPRRRHGRDGRCR